MQTMSLKCVGGLISLGVIQGILYHTRASCLPSPRDEFWIQIHTKMASNMVLSNLPGFFGFFVPCIFILDAVILQEWGTYFLGRSQLVINFQIWLVTVSGCMMAPNPQAAKEETGSQPGLHRACPCLAHQQPRRWKTSSCSRGSAQQSKSARTAGHWKFPTSPVPST